MEEKFTEAFWGVVAAIVGVFAMLAATFRSIVTSHRWKNGNGKSSTSKDHNERFEEEMRREIRRLDDAIKNNTVALAEIKVRLESLYARS